MWIISHGAPVLFRLRVLAVIGLTVIVVAVFSPVRPGLTQGNSMAPTLRSGQPFFFQRPDFGREPVRRGDVLLFRSGAAHCVKRVLALGGEHFWAVGRGASDELTAYRLVAVGAPVRPWKQRWPHFRTRKIAVPLGHLFVVGDSPCSFDSRHYGPIPMSRVVGRVILPGDAGEGALTRIAWTDLPPEPAGRKLTRR